MKADDARGVNKTACRNDTIEHAKQYLGESFKHEVFGVLLGPAAGDVLALRAAGNRARIVGFEKDVHNRVSAFTTCHIEGLARDVAFNGDVTHEAEEYHSAILDWCASAETCLPLTMDALEQNWRPHHNSHLTVGVSYGRADSGLCETAWALGGGKDYAAGLSHMMYTVLRNFVRDTYNMMLRLVGIRTYKSANGGTNMLYVSFRVMNTSPGRYPNVVRTHYNALLPHGAAETILKWEDGTLNIGNEGERDMATKNGTKAALKAWETRRANELKAKRSSTALKAWATRRANQAASLTTAR